MLTTVAVHIIVKHLTADILSHEVNSANKLRFYGVMVSTLDFESSDPSSNLGGTSYLLHATQAYQKSHDGDTDKRQQREHGNMQSILLCGSENFIRFQLQLTQSIAFDSQVNVET